MRHDPIIDVENLTKRYAGHTAVDGLSFQVGAGEIVGLLGPNGAGKSTTMRILACYLPATSGTVRVAGLDVFAQADAVRRRIGYMPENNPLHLEMRVCEYLRFRARLKGLNRTRTRGRVDIVMEQCGLADVQRKLIGHLSKGYRQRVGLADALVHEPELIILDEPTIGLDPNQIRSVRQLIKELGRDHTVLISSHILSEIELTCTRVIILREGRMIVADTTENLREILSGGGQVIAEIAAPADALRRWFEGVAEVDHCELAPLDGDYVRCALRPQAGVDLRPLVFDGVRTRGWRLRELTRQHYSLEDVFVHVTRAVREEEA